MKLTALALLAPISLLAPAPSASPGQQETFTNERGVRARAFERPAREGTRPTGVPEISPTLATGGLLLLVGGTLILIGRRRGTRTHR